MPLPSLWNVNIATEKASGKQKYVEKNRKDRNSMKKDERGVSVKKQTELSEPWQRWRPLLLPSTRASALKFQ